MVSDYQEAKQWWLKNTKCLNPSFNGIWSRTIWIRFSKRQLKTRLNPSFNGIWSWTKLSSVNQLTEKSLNPSFNGIWSRTKERKRTRTVRRSCLNPSFNGIWSRTRTPPVCGVNVRVVLILLLMEYGLGHLGRGCITENNVS